MALENAFPLVAPSASAASKAPISTVSICSYSCLPQYANVYVAIANVPAIVPKPKI